MKRFSGITYVPCSEKECDRSSEIYSATFHLKIKTLSKNMKNGTVILITPCYVHGINYHVTVSFLCISKTTGSLIFNIELSNEKTYRDNQGNCILILMKYSAIFHAWTGKNPYRLRRPQLRTDIKFYIINYMYTR